MVSHAWQGPVGNRWLIVFAGTADGHQPALRAYSTNADPAGPGFMDLLGVYRAPADRGAPLRITSEHDGALALNDGQTFDLRRLDFVGTALPGK